MDLKSTPRTVTLNVKETIARVQINVDAMLTQDAWNVQIYFETAGYDPTTDAFIPGSSTWGTRMVNRMWADIKNDPDVIALHEAIRTKAYQWRDEDIAFEAANPQTPPMPIR